MKDKNLFGIKNSIVGSLADILEMPESALMDAPTIEICSNTEVTIDGCRGILEYDSSSIKIATGKMSVKVTGLDLQLKCMTTVSVNITGTIATIEFLSETGV